MRIIRVAWVLIFSFAVAMCQTAVENQKSARFDGPAELPRVYVATAMADTPAPGPTHWVKPGDDLQHALDQINCGETLKIDPGVTLRGRFQFPARQCDDSHWIIIRSGAPDSDLPDENTRLTPCFAGVASLPDRPDFHCRSLKKAVPTLVFEGKVSGPIIFAAGANHYRLIGLEITRGNPGAKLRNLVQPEEDGTADHIILDRLWVHGTAQDETKTGVHLSGITNAAVINSTFTDLHCIARGGACTDAQAVNGGTGPHPGGPYKIVNNFLEASGENIMFGGAGGTTSPADIEIRRNYLYKPMAWRPQAPNFLGSAAGEPFIVKNHFELKNGQRVLFEGNLLENCWGGFSQAGFSILLTPRNQSDKCAACRVTDVTIRYNRIAHVASALTIGNGLSKEGAAPAEGQRYSIHDLVVDDIDGPKYNGFGLFALVGFQNPPLREIWIRHVTAFPQRAFLSLNIPAAGPKVPNVNITDNIFTAGERQIASAAGGASNCSFQPKRQGPDGVLNSCFASPTVTKNIIIDGSGWPKGNIQVRNPQDAGIVNFKDGNGGDYHICHERGQAPACGKASPGVHAATDGKDIGADIDAIENAISGRD